MVTDFLAHLGPSSALGDPPPAWSALPCLIVQLVQLLLSPPVPAFRHVGALVQLLSAALVLGIKVVNRQSRLRESCRRLVQLGLGPPQARGQGRGRLGLAPVALGLVASLPERPQSRPVLAETSSPLQVTDGPVQLAVVIPQPSRILLRASLVRVVLLLPSVAIVILLMILLILVDLIRPPRPGWR